MTPLPFLNWLLTSFNNQLHMMTLLMVTSYKHLMFALQQQQQKYLNFYLNKIVCCLRLSLFCLYALMWLGLLDSATRLTEAAPHMRLTQRNNHANISELLDNLLRGYDNSIRPGFGGECKVNECQINFEIILNTSIKCCL